MIDEPQKIAFLNTLLPAMDAELYSLPTRRIIAAHGAFESAWGTSKAFVGGNNPFNITRPRDSSGVIITGNDVEFDKGEMKRIVQRFAAYENVSEAIDAYLNFIQHPRYSDAYNVLMEADLEKYFRRLCDGHFFTLPYATYMAGINSCFSTVTQLTTGGMSC